MNGPGHAVIRTNKNINDRVAVYIDGLVGIGGDRAFDWGIGPGVRIKY